MTTTEQAARLAIADVRFDDTTARPRRRLSATPGPGWTGGVETRLYAQDGGQFGAGRPGAAQ